MGTLFPSSPTLPSAVRCSQRLLGNFSHPSRSRRENLGTDSRKRRCANAVEIAFYDADRSPFARTCNVFRYLTDSQAGQRQNVTVGLFAACFRLLANVDELDPTQTAESCRSYRGPNHWYDSAADPYTRMTYRYLL